MSLSFLPLLAFPEFGNTGKYSLGRVLLGAQQDSGLRKEEESHVIKEEKAKLGGSGAHLMQEFKAQKHCRKKGRRSPILQYPRGGARVSKVGANLTPTPRSPNRK